MKFTLLFSFGKPQLWFKVDAGLNHAFCLYQQIQKQKGFNCFVSVIRFYDYVHCIWYSICIVFFVFFTPYNDAKRAKIHNLQS